MNQFAKRILLQLDSVGRLCGRVSKKYKGEYAAYITLNGRIIKKVELSKDSELLSKLVNA